MARLPLAKLKKDVETAILLGRKPNGEGETAENIGNIATRSDDTKDCRDVRLVRGPGEAPASSHHENGGFIGNKDKRSRRLLVEKWRDQLQGIVEDHEEAGSHERDHKEMAQKEKRDQPHRRR